ncbi:superoxide dismutase, partial [Candidatus Woesearchaeota archaeon]|nr:superoxide dismutase [Candidatus Woesearchaeota archaeon]
EIYWDMLGGDGKVSDKLHIVKQLVKDFGSFEKWKEDFIACGKIALGWAVLAFDPSDGKLHNYTGDSHNQGGVWGCIPLITLDVFEHAYYFDNGPDRAKYINAYIDNIKWDNIEKRFKNLAK